MRRRELAGWFQGTFQVSCGRACRLAQFSRAAWYRRSRARDQSALRVRIREFAHARPRFGYLRIWVLLRRDGWTVNRKRVRRLYRLDGLQLRRRVRRRKHIALHRAPPPSPRGPWSGGAWNFVHDALADGRPFRILTVVDQWSESPRIAGSVPADGEQDVPVDTTLAIRFSKPMLPALISTGNLQLIGLGGTESVRVVVAEGGRLAFVSTTDDLFTGSTYTVTVSEGLDAAGIPLPASSFTFTTAPPTTDINDGTGTGPFGRLSGKTYSYGGGVGLGGNTVISPGNGKAKEVGIFSPQYGASYIYSYAAPFRIAFLETSCK